MTMTITLAPQQAVTTAFATGSADLRALGVVNPDGSLATNPATGAPYQTMTAGSTITDADALNPASKCVYLFQGSWDGGTNFVPVGSPYEWTGGTRDKHGNPSGPSFGVAIPTQSPDGTARAPDKIRVMVDPETTTPNLGVPLTLG